MLKIEINHSDNSCNLTNDSKIINYICLHTMLRSGKYKLVFLLACLFTFCLAVYNLNAQDEEELRPIDRIFFGGNFGMQFGTITNIEVSPLVGYHITPRLSAGVGTRFEYFKDKV